MWNRKSYDGADGDRDDDDDESNVARSNHIAHG